ncbi:MAG: hypothetical protein JRI92_03480 [Deltaproteobacteria bacterium]|nr:hypothetical protein [Deltaproteobacteria bacterium]
MKIFSTIQKAQTKTKEIILESLKPWMYNKSNVTSQIVRFTVGCILSGMMHSDNS